MQVTVVFDGNCGFCWRSVLWLQGLDRAGHVGWAAAQEGGVRTRFGLTRAQTDAAAWAITASGNRYQGAQAVLAALAAATECSLPLRLFEYAPFRVAAQAAYAWIARNRRLLPGVAPYCQEHACPE